jgi:hypothetical protein
VTDVKEFITGGRYETLSLHHVLQGFSTAECDWLIPPGAAALHQPRVSVTDSLKRRELLEEFMFWYFDSFVIPLIKVSTSLTDPLLIPSHNLKHFTDNILRDRFIRIPRPSTIL